jgi:galactoside O-acetyltransferase
VHPDLRRDGSQFSAPVTIEDDVWIGAGAILLPGVVVGAGSVVGAGAVVGSNVPPGVVVAGVPARIIRRITDVDRDFRYRPPRDLAVDPAPGPAAVSAVAPAVDPQRPGPSRRRPD